MKLSYDVCVCKSDYADLIRNISTAHFIPGTFNLLFLLNENNISFIALGKNLIKKTNYY